MDNISFLISCDLTKAKPNDIPHNFAQIYIDISRITVIAHF